MKSSPPPSGRCSIKPWCAVSSRRPRRHTRRSSAPSSHSGEKGICPTAGLWTAPAGCGSRQPSNSLDEALRHTASTYRKALWADLPDYAEVWIEKDALAGAVLPVTSEFDVPLTVARGFASLSFLASAAEYMDDLDKQVFVYQLGNHDPSGIAAAASIENTLRELTPSADITFERLAVTPAQIERLSLSLRPTKRSNSRAAKFTAEFAAGSVELDAIHPDTLRAIVRGAIERHIDQRQLETLMAAERGEREMLRMFASNVRTAQDGAE